MGEARQKPFPSVSHVYFKAASIYFKDWIQLYTLMFKAKTVLPEPSIIINLITIDSFN